MLADLRHSSKALNPFSRGRAAFRAWTTGAWVSGIVPRPFHRSAFAHRIRGGACGRARLANKCNNQPALQPSIEYQTTRRGPHWVPCVRGFLGSGGEPGEPVGQRMGPSDGRRAFRQALPLLIASCGQPGRRTRTNARGETFKRNGASRVHDTDPIRQQRSAHAAFLAKRLWRCSGYCRRHQRIDGIGFAPTQAGQERDGQRPSLRKCIDSSVPDSIGFMPKNVGGRSA
jgi:hypothetical protein